MYIKIIIFSAFVLGLLGALTYMNNKDLNYYYIITETGMFSSLDPLDGDQTQNLPVQRMIYATPLEIDSKGSLSSSILESYEYNESENKISWIVAKDLKFSDGQPITADDVAFAVARMAYKRPKFPVIEHIKGVQQWSKRNDALKTLPEGIQTSGQKIEIFFDQAVDHPLFRFSLEIFSVIPKSCVDLKTNKVVCESIPTSGYYGIKNKSDSKIEFVRNDFRYSKDRTFQIPDRISFLYKKNLDALQIEHDSMSVVQGNEINWGMEEHARLKQNFKIRYLPSARIALMEINPHHSSLVHKNCRLIFAQAYRQAFSNLFKDHFKTESSLFTEVITGYIKNQDLEDKFYHSIPNMEKERCLATLRKNPPLYAQTPDPIDEMHRQTMLEAYNILGIQNVKPVLLNSRSEETQAFLDGRISVIGASTGFWAMDPAGDVQMLLTPNMHKILQFVANDDQVQSLIKKLKTSEDKKQAYENLNEYMYSQANFNVFSHIRRFYASSSIDHIAELPTSITSPAPYQVFRMK